MAVKAKREAITIVGPMRKKVIMQSLKQETLILYYQE